MVRSSPALAEFEAAYQRTAFRGLSFADALGRFGAMWAEARALNRQADENWFEDLVPDLAVARALNGLPLAVDLTGLILALTRELHRRHIGFHAHRRTGCPAARSTSSD